MCCSIQARPGFEELKVANTEPREAWELERTQIAFQNPEWTRFVKTIVMLEMLMGLGIAHIKVLLDVNSVNSFYPLLILSMFVHFFQSSFC